MNLPHEVPLKLGCRQESERTPEKMFSGHSLSRLDAPVCRLDAEYFPEITLLEVTCDSILPGSVPATPLTAGSVKSRFAFPQPSPFHYTTNLNPILSETGLNDIKSAKENTSEVHSPELSRHNGTTASKDLNVKMVDSPESKYAPERFLDFPEITLLDATRDSDLSQGGELSSMEATRDISPMDSLKNNMPPSELSGQTAAEPVRSDMNQTGELSNTLTGSVTHTTSSLCEQSDKSVGGSITQASLELTRDVSTGSVLENSRPALEHSRQDMAKIQATAEDTLGTHPANVTHSINSSDMSVLGAASEVSTSDVQCNNSLKNVTSELQSEPVATSNTVEAKNVDPLPSNDAELTSVVPQSSQKTAGSLNGTFTTLQSPQLSPSTNLNTTTQIPGPQNNTLDLPSSNEDSPKAESVATDQATSVSENTIETSLVLSETRSAVKAGNSCDMQNATFDRHSLRKSSGNTILGEAGAATFCLQNTFDTKPPLKQNGTITLSESSGDSHQSTFDKPLKVCNATSSPKENKSEHSQSGLPVTDGLSDPLGQQSMDMESNKANTFDWEDSLDLKADFLITSTPMTGCKNFIFNPRQEEGKIVGAQKNLYGDGPSKPDGQVPSDVPSNIISDRKTFLTHPAGKSLLPPSKAASQLLKPKPASALPGRCEPLTSGLPMTRQRAQAEALRNTAAPDAPQASTGISSSYRLRPSTTGFKPPSSGLQRPQLSGIPSGIQRAATGLRPPSARINSSASSISSKLRGPTAANPATKTSQGKKQPLTRGETLPVAKRKRLDAPLPPSSAEVPASSCDAANKAKSLKQPTTSKRALPAKPQKDDVAMPASTRAETSTCSDTSSKARALKQPATTHRAALAKPRGHGCANCTVLEQQLKMQAEEIKRLKEELLKKSEEDEYF
ncbi:uncharacterized protein LOC117246817 isoform X1 [Epinephelus lanceolatus]